MHPPIMELQGLSSKLKIYSDYIEGEFDGLDVINKGSFYYKVHYNEITSVELIKEGEINYLIIDYKGKPKVDKLDKLPSNNSFWPKENYVKNYYKAKAIIDFLIRKEFDKNEINKILNDGLDEQEINKILNELTIIHNREILLSNNKRKVYIGMIWCLVILLFGGIGVSVNNNSRVEILNNNNYSIEMSKEAYRKGYQDAFRNGADKISDYYIFLNDHPEIKRNDVLLYKDGFKDAVLGKESQY